jgi:hypothetical protein
MEISMPALNPMIWGETGCLLPPRGKMTWVEQIIDVFWVS